MKVLLSAQDVSAMLAAQWGLPVDEVSVAGIDEIAVEIPAALLGLPISEPTTATATRKTTKKTTTTKSTPKQKKVEEELDELAEIEEAVEDKKVEAKDDDFLDEDEDIDFS